MTLILLPLDEVDESQIRRRPPRVAPAVGVPRSVEVEYRRALRELVGTLRDSTKLIGKAIGEGASQVEVINALREQRDKDELRFRRAKDALPGKTLDALSDYSKKQVEKILTKSIGVSFAKILESPGIGDALEVARHHNSDLIVNLHEQHYKMVNQAVLDNYGGIVDGESLSKRLQRINDINKTRADLIARDQTSKLTGDLARIRMQSVGIEEYIWRTAMDERVVGTPGGVYPGDGSHRHGNHYKRDGKKYRFDAPPHDGNPGYPINAAVGRSRWLISTR